MARVFRTDNDGYGVTATASFTPAAAAYSGADVISTAKEFAFTFANGAVVPAGSLIRIVTSIIRIDQTAVISGETSYSLALYNVTPPSAQADNAAWTLASADLAAFLGTLALGTPADLGAACYVKTQFTDQQDFKLITSSLYGALITAGGFTATAVARSITLKGYVI